MKNKKLYSLLFASVQLCSTLFYTNILKSTSGARNMEGDQKQQVNFYGTLITHQGQQETVDNISIGGKYKDVIMYDAPIKKNKEIINPKTKQAEIKLDDNPSEAFVKSKINLCTVKEISVPKPNTVWYYQKEEKSQRIEFTELHVVSQEGPAKSYLLEHKTHIYCNSMDKTGSEKKEVPLTAISKLIIEGYGEKRETSPCPTAKSNTPNTTPKID